MLRDDGFAPLDLWLTSHDWGGCDGRHSVEEIREKGGQREKGRRRLGPKQKERAPRWDALSMGYVSALEADAARDLDKGRADGCGLVNACAIGLGCLVGGFGLGDQVVHVGLCDL